LLLCRFILARIGLSDLVRLLDEFLSSAYCFVLSRAGAFGGNSGGNFSSSLLSALASPLPAALDPVDHSPQARRGGACIDRSYDIDTE
jgi:hypothetical protein